MTETPISNPQACPAPTGKFVSDLDPAARDYKIEKEKILSHPNYSESETIVIKPGINKIENDEQAEYLYKTIGNPEDGGMVTFSDGDSERIINQNVLFEVDEDGKEIKDNFYKKYRQVKRGVHVR